MDDTARRGGRRRGMKRARGRSGPFSRLRQRVKMPLWIRPRLSEAFFGALAGKGSFLPFAAKTGALGKAGQKGRGGSMPPACQAERGGRGKRVRRRQRTEARKPGRSKANGAQAQGFACRDSSPMATGRHDCFWQGHVAPRHDRLLSPSA